MAKSKTSRLYLHDETLVDAGGSWFIVEAPSGYRVVSACVSPLEDDADYSNYSLGYHFLLAEQHVDRVQFTVHATLAGTVRWGVLLERVKDTTDPDLEITGTPV